MIKLSEGGIAEMWKDEKSPEMQAISYALQKAVAMVIEKAEKTKCFSDIDKLDEKTLDYFAVEQRQCTIRRRCRSSRRKRSSRTL